MRARYTGSGAPARAAAGVSRDRRYSRPPNRSSSAGFVVLLVDRTLVDFALVFVLAFADFVVDRGVVAFAAVAARDVVVLEPADLTASDPDPAGVVFVTAVFVSVAGTVGIAGVGFVEKGFCRNLS